MNQSTSSAVQSQHTCLICQSPDITALVCSHLLCTNCIITLVRTRNRKCPICRTRITWHVPAIQQHLKLRADQH